MSKKILLPVLFALSSLVGSTYAAEKPEPVHNNVGQVKTEQSISLNISHAAAFGLGCVFAGPGGAFGHKHFSDKDIAGKQTELNQKTNDLNSLQVKYDDLLKENESLERQIDSDKKNVELLYDLCGLEKNKDIDTLVANFEDYYKQGKTLEKCLGYEHEEQDLENLLRPLWALNKYAEECDAKTKESFDSICQGSDVLNKFNSFSEPMKKVFLEYSIKSMAALEASQTCYNQNTKKIKDKYDKLHDMVLKKWE